VVFSNAGYPAPHLARSESNYNGIKGNNSQGNKDHGYNDNRGQGILKIMKDTNWQS